MATTYPKLTLRHATVEDIPRMMEVADAAFGEDAVSRAMWPERLEPDPVKRNADKRAWYAAEHRRGMQEDKGRLWICVEIEEEGKGKDIAGWASWHIISAGEKRNPEDGAAASNPKALDTEFLGRLRKVVDEAVEKAFGKDGTVGMYTFRPIVTDPKYQRKGVGRMILDWGIARAGAEGKDIFIGSTDAGYTLYTAGGFQTVGECVNEGMKQRLMVWRAPRT